MSITLKIRDQTTTGNEFNELILELLTENITIRELIRSRVFQEVKDYNAKSDQFFCGLVQPTGTEKTLNGYKMEKSRQIDWEPQFQKALEAFETNRIIVLIDEHQAESLEEEVVITPDTVVTFLKLVPLVGG